MGQANTIGTIMIRHNMCQHLIVEFDSHHFVDGSRTNRSSTEAHTHEIAIAAQKLIPHQ